MDLDHSHQQEVIKLYQLHTEDTQSADIQIAILTERIHLMMEESSRVPFDRTIRMFLMKLVAKRRKLLLYLKTTDTSRFDRLVSRLGLQT